jgi:broad specificity phosphatase PhoE
MLADVEVVFIRHGEPAWAPGDVSVDDPHLTGRGREQARLAAEALRDLPVDELLVSPLVRAQQTAAPIAEVLDMAPVTLPWLAEISAGRWEGTPLEQVQRAFREQRGRPLEQQWAGMPGGESFRDFHRRVTTGLRALLDDAGALQVSEHPPLWKLVAPERRIVVVAHGGTNAVGLGHLLGVAPVPWEWERFVSFHASISTVQPVEISDGHAFSLFRFADTRHLPPDLCTV